MGNLVLMAVLATLVLGQQGGQGASRAESKATVAGAKEPSARPAEVPRAEPGSAPPSEAEKGKASPAGEAAPETKPVPQTEQKPQESESAAKEEPAPAAREREKRGGPVAAFWLVTPGKD